MTSNFSATGVAASCQRARGARGRACRRGARADVRALPHQGRRPGRGRRGDARRRTTGEVRPRRGRARCSRSCIPAPDATRDRAPRGRRGSADRVRRRRLRGGRQAGRRRRAPQRRAGPARPCSVTSPAPGFTIATSRRARAAGHRAAARRRHLGADGRREVGVRLLAAQARLQAAHRRQDLPRAGAGPSRPARRHDRRPDRPAPQARLQVHGRSGRPAQRDALRHARGAPLRVAARDQARDRTHPPDPGAHERASPPLRRGPHLWRRPGAGQAGRAAAAVAARGPARLRAPRARDLRGVRVGIPRRPRARVGGHP